MQVTRYNAHETERMHELHGVELASFGRRAMAFAIDFVLGGLVFMTPFFVMILLAGGGHWRMRVESHSDADTVNLNFFGNWYSVIWWVLYFGLATYFGKGRTPGKRLMGIRVVSLVHERLGLWHCIERALGYGASALEFGFGFAQYFVHPNRRTVHDRIAETIVVADRPLRAPAPVASPESAQQAG